MRPEVSPRHGGIEAARLIAALGIVWFHMQAPGAAFAYAALALFVLMTADLAGRAALTQGAGPVMRSRAARLILPFGVWSVVYLALESLRARAWPDPGVLWAQPWLILQGGEIHLWFLPFAALALLALPLVPRLSQAGVTAWAAAVVAGATVSVASYWLHDRVPLPAPFGSWSFAIPPFVLGLTMAAARGAGRTWPGGVLLLAVVVPAGLMGITDGVLQLLIATLVLTLAWAAPLTGAIWRHLGALAFGVYLIHPAVALVLFRAAPQSEGTVAGTLAIFALSLGLVALLQQVPGLRRVL